jgi:hypothetical protein
MQHHGDAAEMHYCEGTFRILTCLFRSTLTQGKSTAEGAVRMRSKHPTVWEDCLDAILPIAGSVAAFIILMAILAV